MSEAYNKWLQSRLTSHGFPVGAIDGDIGATTRKALRAFQISRGLTITGTATAATEAALRASSVIVSPAVKAELTFPDARAIRKIDLVPPTWPRQKDVTAHFGKVGEHQKTIAAPYEMHLAWSLTTRVKGITVHEKVAEAVQSALEEIASIYSAPERSSLGVDLFGGSLNVRRMRGGTAWSMHSWGIAIDFDPLRNGLTTQAPDARLSHADAKPFWDAWRAVGALPLGQAIGRDWMHVQFARLF